MLLGVLDPGPLVGVHGRHPLTLALEELDALCELGIPLVLEDEILDDRVLLVDALFELGVLVDYLDEALEGPEGLGLIGEHRDGLVQLGEGLGLLA